MSRAGQPASTSKHLTKAETLRHTRKSYVKRSPGGIGHWVIPVDPSITGVSCWGRPCQCRLVDSLPSLLYTLTTRRSCKSTSMAGHGHLPLMPITGLANPSGLAVTQVISQL